MIFNRFQKADRWIVGLACVCFVTSLYFIVNDRWLVSVLSEDTEGLESIGNIATVEQDVRRRYKVAFSWLPLQSDDVIFKGDSIFTGPNSGATIKTFRGEEIYIAPNSLVVISSQNNSLLLKIDYGSIKGKVEDGKKLFISSGDGVTEFSGSKAVVDVKVKKNKPLVVKVLEGEVKVTSNEKQNTLGRNQTVEVNPAISLDALLPPMQIYGPKQQKPTQTAENEAQQIVLPAAPKVPSPKITAAKKRFVLQKGKQTWVTASLPNFRWTPVEGAKSYDFEISADVSFKKPLFRHTTGELRVRWRKPEHGRYFVRVRARTEDSVSSFSGTQVFEVKWPSPKSLSEGKIEEEVSELSLMDLPPPPLEVKWTSLPETPFYELHFSDTPDFKKNLILTTAMNEKKVQPPLPGTYYWKVRALNLKKLPTSDFSDTFTVTFNRIYQNPEKVKDLITLYPKLGQSVVFVGKGNDKLQFRWSRPFTNVTYRLQISSSSKFDTLLADKTTSKNWLTISDNLTPGNIFWRVRAERPFVKTPWTRVSRFELVFQKSGFDLSSPSAFPKPKEPPALPSMFDNRSSGTTVSTFIEPSPSPTPVPAPVVPTQLSAPKNFVVTLRKTDRAPNSLAEQLDLIEDFPRFSWNVPTADLIYILEVSENEKFKTLVFSKKIITPPFEWRKFSPGRYYWRVASENTLGQRSEFSSTESIEIKLPAPTVKDDVNHFPFLEWYPQIFVSNYEVEVSRTEDFSDAKRFISPYHTFKKSTFAPGRYFWRVRSFYGRDSLSTGYSKINTFEFDPKAQQLADAMAFNPPKRAPAKTIAKPPPAPVVPAIKEEPLLPPDLDGDNSSFSVRFDKAKISNPWMLSRSSIGSHLSTLKDFPLFKWFSSSKTKTYFKFEIARDIDFKEKLVSKDLHVQHYQWRTFQPGVYYWRVASKNSKGDMSAFSSAQKFTITMDPPASPQVQVAKPEARSPSAKNEKIYELTWEPVPFARLYEVLLARDSQFKDVKVLKTNHPLQKIQINTAGTYYWKVKALDAQQRSLTPFTSVQSLAVP